jgi:heme exporter protein C
VSAAYLSALGWAVPLLALVGLGLLLSKVCFWDPRREAALLAVGVTCLILGLSAGLFATPPETKMRDVMRILYVHVPTAWNALVFGTVAVVAAIGSLVNKKRSWDATNTAAVEVGLVFVVMLIIQGSIWGKATWDSFWEWDPRLTTTAIMGVSFAGVLSLRSFADGADRKRVWTSVATIIAYIDVPIVYFVVDLAPGIHQERSSPGTVSDEFEWPLRAAAFGLLFIGSWLVLNRGRLELLQGEAAAVAPVSEGPAVVAGGE